jgi:hypothetical protein
MIPRGGERSGDRQHTPSAAPRVPGLHRAPHGAGDAVELHKRAQPRAPARVKRAHTHLQRHQESQLRHVRRQALLLPRQRGQRQRLAHGAEAQLQQEAERSRQRAHAAEQGRKRWGRPRKASGAAAGWAGGGQRGIRGRAPGGDARRIDGCDRHGTRQSTVGFWASLVPS